MSTGVLKGIGFEMTSLKPSLVLPGRQPVSVSMKGMVNTDQVTSVGVHDVTMVTLQALEDISIASATI